ncbi:MAG: type IV pilin-like G/H family protein [Cyanobacteria bacterium P01_A01_bin.37]
MKSELKAKFIQHLIKKRENEGFTLIELLVVIIIIGILSAIALPSFLNQANRARESEAKQYVGSMNRAQQAFYLDEIDFSNAMSELGLGLATQTTNYKYTFATATAGTTDSAVTNQGQPIRGGANSPIRAYVGGVAAHTQGAAGEATTTGVLCEGITPPVAGGPGGADTAVYANTAPPTCPNPGVDYDPIS